MAAPHYDPGFARLPYSGTSAPIPIDFRPVVTGISIDPRKCRSVDDAFEVVDNGDGYRILAHISDAARLVQLGSSIDCSAAKKGFTRYWPDWTDSMLPPEVCEGRGSLVVNQTRPTLTASIDLSKEGVPNSVTLRQTRVAGLIRLGADEVGPILADPRAELHLSLSLMEQVAQLLYARRQQTAVQATLVGGRKILEEEDGGGLGNLPGKAMKAYFIVTELSILVNCLVARYCRDQGIPVLYHNCSLKPIIQPENAKTLARILPLNGKRLGELMSGRTSEVGRAHYSTMSEGHLPLGCDAYMHFTAPLRRYADLVSHRNIKAHLLNQPYTHSTEELERIAAEIHEAQAHFREAREGRQPKMRGRQLAEAQVINPEETLRLLEPNQFSQLVSVVVEEAQIPRLFEQEVKSRLWAKRLSLRDFELILGAPGSRTEWQGLRFQLLCALDHYPQWAKWLLKSSCELQGLKQIQYRCEVEWTSRRRAEYRAQVTVFGSKLEVSELQLGGSQQEAEGRAASALLISRLGFEFGSELLSWNAHARALPVDRYPHLLSRYCVSRGLAQPTYVTSKSGPGRALTWHMECSVTTAGGYVVAAKGAASNLVTAKNVAAGEVLRRLYPETFLPRR